MSTNLTSKGQVTIPKAVRELMGVGPGDAVDFKLNADGEVTLSRACGTPRPPSRFEALLGIAGPGPSTDEIMAMMRGEPPIGA